jgi:hypothetical protein
MESRIVARSFFALLLLPDEVSALRWIPFQLFIDIQPLKAFLVSPH